MSFYRRMSDRHFRDQQYSRLREPHIAPFTELVEELSTAQRPMPFIAPLYGGTEARVLSLLASPGPSTRAHSGSGMLCVENVDATAERMGHLLAEAHIPIGELLPWNAYPWYIPGAEDRPPTAAELEAGVEPLRRLLALAPRIGVAVLHGGVAQNGWRKFRNRHPGVARKIRALPTYSTADRTFVCTADERQRRMDDLRSTFAQVAAMLNTADATGPSVRGS